MVHPPSYTAYTPPHKPLPFTPILCYSPCLPDIQSSFLNSLSWYQSTSSMTYLLSDYQHTLLHRLLAILSFSNLSTCRTTGEQLYQSFHLPDLSVHTISLSVHLRLSIILIPKNPLRLSMCTALIIDLSFQPYIRIGTSNILCKTTTLKLQFPSIN